MNGKKDKSNQVTSWPLASIGILSIVGMVVAGELIRIHIMVHTDPSYHSFCALSETVNCDTVAESPYAVFWFLPVAIWGILGYIAIGILSLWGLKTRRQGKTSWPSFILLMLTTFSVIVDIILGYISHKLIRSFCVFCISSYAISFLQFIISIANLKAYSVTVMQSLIEDFIYVKNNLMKIVTAGIIGVICLGLLYMFYPRYWIHEMESSGEEIKHKISRGITEDGLPWIGAKNPMLTIIEFSDYQCPHCRRAHSRIRELIKQNPQKLRMVHRHYPLDNQCNPILQGKSFHKKACLFSRMAICAQKQNKFWEMNDLLFEQQSSSAQITPDEYAKRIGLKIDQFNSCLESTETMDELKRDIDDGIKLRIVGTPTFLVNDQLYPGMIPPEVLEPVTGSSNISQ